MRHPKVKILAKPNPKLGYSYAVQDKKKNWQTFAYTWAVRIGSKKWWSEMIFAGDLDEIEILKLAEKLKKKNMNK